jgi:tetratricopeptide (TPR) repeat protein
MVFMASADESEDLKTAKCREMSEPSLEKLEAFARSPDLKVARLASQVSTGIGMLTQDWAKLQSHAARALSLGANDDEIWDAMIGATAMLEQWDKLIEICQRHLKQRDTAHDRYFLAKAYGGAKQWDKAENLLRAILKQDPHSFEENLGLAALLLRRHEEAEALKESRVLLNSAESAVDSPSESQKRDYDFITALRYALTDDIQTARLKFQKILKVYPDDKDSKEALEALAVKAQ